MAQLSSRDKVAYTFPIVPAGTVVTTAGTITGGAAGAGLAWIVKGLVRYDYLQAILNVTAAATEAGDTLDVFLDTSFDQGLTWVDNVHFTQLLGTGGAKREAAVVTPFSQTATAPVNVAADAASGAVRHLLGDWVRARVVAVDVATLANMSFTFGLQLEFS